MELNEIKKALYKEKPKANCTITTPEFKMFSCKLENGERIGFHIPMPECDGMADFQPAQLLIRWIIRKTN